MKSAVYTLSPCFDLRQNGGIFAWLDSAQLAKAMRCMFLLVWRRATPVEIPVERIEVSG